MAASMTVRSNAEAQGCGDCAPLVGTNLGGGSRLVYIDPAFGAINVSGSQADSVASGFIDAEGHFGILTGYPYFTFTQDQNQAPNAQIQVFKASIVQGSSTLTGYTTSNGQAVGTIQLKSSIMDAGGAERHNLIRHEIGHMSNMRDVTTGGCQAQSVMFYPYSSGNATDFTTADDCAAGQAWKGGESPIFISLDRKTPTFSNVDAGVLFDITGCGSKLTIAWPTVATVGLLALDLNGNGIIDDGTELFGNHTRLPDGSVAFSGYSALDVYDEDRNGAVDANDTIFHKLFIWTDELRDGISQPSELHSLSDFNIVSISTDYHSTHRLDKWGNELRYRAEVRFGRASGVTQSWDVFLKVKIDN